jgi:putative glutamine amidotransferase
MVLDGGLPPSGANATILGSMNPTAISGPTAERPRVGIPWRTSQEQRENVRQKLDTYFEAVRKAGAEPVEVSLQQSPEQLQRQLSGLDAFVLPGSPADVDPARYGAAKHQKTHELDANRDTTDLAILDHAFKAAKPVLAICYGCQLLNVYLQGSLIQDIRAERPQSIAHGSTDLPSGASNGDVQHTANLSPDGRLRRLSEAAQATINSSHHQAIDKPGKNLRITALASDGTIEGVEWTGDSNWVVGVQWHPERMVGDAFSERLFSDFVAAAREFSRGAHGSVVQKA